MAEPGVKSPRGDDLVCQAMSPGGWSCCLPPGHDRNHIGTTADYGTLYQWPQDEATADAG